MNNSLKTVLLLGLLSGLLLVIGELLGGAAGPGDRRSALRS